jgi:hypothetical protein
MSNKTTNGLLGLMLATYLAVVVYRGNATLFWTNLFSERPFASWFVALVLFAVVRNTVSGRARIFVNLTGTIAGITALVITQRNNPQLLTNATSHIHRFLQPTGVLSAPDIPVISTQ